MICAMKRASTDHILHMYAPSVISSNLYVYCVHDCIDIALQKLTGFQQTSRPGTNTTRDLTKDGAENVIILKAMLQTIF